MTTPDLQRKQLRRKPAGLLFFFAIIYKGAGFGYTNGIAVKFPSKNQNRGTRHETPASRLSSLSGLYADAAVSGRLCINAFSVTQPYILAQNGFTNTETLTGTAQWGKSAAKISDNLEDWADKVLTNGFANVDMAIMGKTALRNFLADEKISKMLDNRRVEMGLIHPRDLPNGVKYLGHLNDPSLDMYVYGEVYYDDWTNPDAPETKPLIPDNMIILISSRPNYMMAYGACTYIEDASGLWVTSQTSRVLRSYVEHHPDRRMVELQAHPLPIPDKVDSWLVATVC